jgi:hypothetical protein
MSMSIKEIIKNQYDNTLFSETNSCNKSLKNKKIPVAYQWISDEVN